METNRQFECLVWSNPSVAFVIVFAVVVVPGGGDDKTITRSGERKTQTDVHTLSNRGGMGDWERKREREREGGDMFLPGS